MYVQSVFSVFLFVEYFDLNTFLIQFGGKLGQLIKNRWLTFGANEANI